MNAADICLAAPGSRFLLMTDEDDRDAAHILCGYTLASKQCLDGKLRILSVDLFSADHPNSFDSLKTLVARLIRAADRKSHFEGLLLLNVADLHCERDAARLKALGEFISIPDGLASQCITVFYGPERKRDYIKYAEHLDFDGKLRVDLLEEQHNHLSLREELFCAKHRCDSAITTSKLMSLESDLVQLSSFDMQKFFNAISNSEGVITLSELEDAINSPYSYLNRMRYKADHDSKYLQSRKIGFQKNR